jgi:hypothetical protein
LQADAASGNPHSREPGIFLFSRVSNDARNVTTKPIHDFCRSAPSKKRFHETAFHETSRPTTLRLQVMPFPAAEVGVIRRVIDKWMQEKAFPYSSTWKSA